MVEDVPSCLPDLTLTPALGLPGLSYSVTRIASSGKPSWLCLQGSGSLLKCLTLVSVLPSDSCHGLHDRHHFQVRSRTVTTRWCVLQGSVGHLWAGSHLYGWILGMMLPEVVVLESFVCGMCLWPLSTPSLQCV